VAITVGFAVSGNATFPADYSIQAATGVTSITQPSGSVAGSAPGAVVLDGTTASPGLRLFPASDGNAFEGPESATVTLLGYNGVGTPYFLSTTNPTSATMIIADVTTKVRAPFPPATPAKGAAEGWGWGGSQGGIPVRAKQQA
jgi:hypothetical protein